MVGESKTEVLKLSSEFDIFRKSFETVGGHVSKPTDVIVHTDQQGKFFSKLSTGVQEALYALYASKDLDISSMERAKRYAALATTQYKGAVSKQLVGACIAMLSVFQSLALIKPSGKALVFEEGIARFVTEQIETRKSVRDEDSKVIIEDIRAGKMADQPKGPAAS